MFALSDLVVIEVVENSLQNLRSNPHHLDYILGGYSNTDFIKKIQGRNFITKCKELILQNKIKIAPYYILDSETLPNFSVAATYSEAELALGDYVGAEQEILPPRCVGRFDASYISDDLKHIVIPESFKAQDFILPGMFLCNGDFATKIEYGMPYTENLTDFEIHVNDELPRKLTGWEVKNTPASSVATINGSGNACTVFIKVKSSGDVELHKVLCLVLRYCLRYGRKQLEENNLYTSTTTQEMLVLENEEQMIFASSFILTGKAFDFWIREEHQTPDQIRSTAFATPKHNITANPTDNDNEIVNLDEGDEQWQ